MRLLKRLVLPVLLIAAMFSGPAADAAHTNLPAGILIGDKQGIQVSAEGEYFIDWKGLQASDTLTKSLIIRNIEPYAYKITMTALPLIETGPLHLLDEVYVTLTMDGKVLYDGRVRGDDGVNMILNALDLGRYQSGDSRVLDINMRVNPDMKKYRGETSEAFFQWHFYAVREVPPEEGPKTGEIILYGLYALLGCLTVATGILIILGEKQRGKQREPER